MKSAPTSLKFVPLYGLAALTLGGFVSGATIKARYVPNDDVDPSSLPANWFTGGLGMAGFTLLFGALAIVAAIFRYFAYGRIERAIGSRKWLNTVVLVLEAVFVVVSVGIIWAASEPVIDAGFVIILFIQLTVVWLVLSLAVFAASFAIAKRFGTEKAPAV